MAGQDSPNHLSEPLQWLYGTQLFGMKLGLEPMERLVEALGLTAWRPRTIHVAGTNGKGSTCAMIEAMARADGRRTGLFTSPHLISFAERIRIGGTPLAALEIEEGLNRIRQLVAHWSPHPTFFEITTALAWWAFHSAKCDFIVLETGMGGRLDATNALPTDYSVITPIGLDHMKWLGSTLTEIAGEKAGIIKPGHTVICGPQDPEALAVIKTRAQGMASRLLLVDRPVPAGACALPGRHQRWNAAVASGAALAADLSRTSILQGLATVTWPGRFQRLPRPGGGETILDGAHNPHGMAALVEAWREAFGSTPATVIFGAVADKQTAEVLDLLRPIANRLHLTTPQSSRAVPLDELQALAPDAATHLCFADAYQAVCDSQHPVLVCGSLYLIGEALAHLRPDSGIFEPSGQ
jgi:dihydrofolate synthase / folylpolyglutamate synthase